MLLLKKKMKVSIVVRFFDEQAEKTEKEAKKIRWVIF
jgi:hypothetical protein